MNHRNLARVSSALALAAAASFLMPAAATAETVPDDLTVMPPVPNDYQPARTAWGDPDFRGTWPINDIAELPVSRPDQYGNRFFKTAEELAKEEARAQELETAYAAEQEQDTIGSGHWIEYLAGSRRTSMLVDPLNGKLPALTAKGQALYEAGRSSWVPNQKFDWVTDFDAWDRCITRGFPASMLPFRYNNGIRIFQAPGQVVVHLEMLGTRIVPVVPKAQWEELQKTRWNPSVRTWMGQSLGYWEDDNTLVIETTNIVAGDSASDVSQERGASPLNMATRGVPPYSTLPMSEEATVVERLHMIGPDTITYEMTYSDPVMWAAPFTTRVDWTRDDAYEFFEYACHEGNVQVRNFITASRADRQQQQASAGDTASGVRSE